MKVSKIKEYLKFITKQELDVEIIDNTIDIIKDECFHIYIDVNSYDVLLIGTFNEEDFVAANAISSSRYDILAIYKNIE